MNICINTPDPLPRPEWTNEEKARSLKQQNTEIQFENMALNVTLKQNTNSVKNNIDDLDDNAAADCAMLFNNEHNPHLTSLLTTVEKNMPPSS